MRSAISANPPPDGTVPVCVGICGPATVDTPPVPADDVCLEVGGGVGQTRWSLQPCTPPVTSTATMIVTPPVPAVRLPETGLSTGTAGWAIVLIVAGAALVQAARYRR